MQYARLAPSHTPFVQTEFITIPYQAGLGALRQTLATRLQEYENPQILKITFTLYLSPEVVDLGTLPSAYRGNITGEGELALEITITKSGNFSKGQIESLVESLPNIKNAEYSSKIEIQKDNEE